MTVPLFKTTFSIGKSLFTFKKGASEASAPNIIDLAVREGLKEVFLIEDSATGFPDAYTKFKEAGIKLNFGISFPLGDEELSSKVVAIAQNDKGIKTINKIHTKVGFDDFVGLEFLKENRDGVQICIPFYDSFLFKNIMEYGRFTLDVKPLDPIFFIENNLLPFDCLIQEAVESFCKEFDFRTLKTKTILYENREDAMALQTYKMITGRKAGGIQSSISRPNLDHFGSKEFCWESYKELEEYEPAN